MEVCELRKPFIQKLHRLGHDYPAEELRADESRFESEFLKIAARFGMLRESDCVDGAFAYRIVENGNGTEVTPLPSARAMIELLHLQRHGESLIETAHRLKQHPDDADALQKLQRTERDAQSFFFGKQPIVLPPGGINRIFHQEILNFAIDLDLHTEKISDEKWAACFDKVCPCEGTHDAKNLRKWREQILKARGRAAAIYGVSE